MEVNTQTLRAVADKENSIKDNLSGLISDLDRIQTNLSRDFTGKAGNDIIKSVKNVKSSLSDSKNKMNKMTSVLRQSAEYYETAESKAEEYDCSPVEYDADKNMDIWKMTGLSSALPDAIATQQMINKYIKDFKIKVNINGKDVDLTKLLKNKIKKTFKDITKGTGFEDIGSAYKIWSKVADGKYAEAFTEAVETVGGDSVDIFSKDKEGINWDGMKIKAVLNTIEKVTDDDGYIQRYMKYYEQKELDAARNLDILGVVSAMGGSFVQTVGKGSVDVLCSTISDSVDSYFKVATGGLFTLTSINDAMYEAMGWSPGHMFNDVTKSISGWFDKVFGYKK